MPKVSVATNSHPGPSGREAAPQLVGAAMRVLGPRFEGIPPELAAIPRWVLWRLEKRAGKPAKVPYSPTGTRAATDSPSSWSALRSVREAYEYGGFSGVGFVFNGDGLVGIDLDRCRDPQTAEIEEHALDILGMFSTYAEASPSGTGIKLFCRGRLPGHRRRQDDIEMYGTGRFFAVTGHRLDGMPPAIVPCQGAVDALYRRLFGGANAQPTRPCHLGGPRPADAMEPPAGKLADLCMSDPVFKTTWEHRRLDMADQSASGYDLALASRAAAAGWSDEEIADLLFTFRRRHGLDTTKATREDYVARTIARARFCDVGYTLPYSTVIHVRRHCRRLLPQAKAVIVRSLAR